MEAIISQELEQMRSEMSNLKSMLKEQEIINEKLMRRAMSKSYNKERNYIRRCIAMALIAIPLYLILLPKLGMPLWFSIVTIIFFLAAVAASVFSLRRYASEDLLTGNLLTVAEKIIKYKRFGNNWLKFSIPFLVLWVIGFFHYLSGNACSDFTHGVIYGGIVGLAVGLTLGIINYRQSMKRLNGILKQIDEMKEEQ